MSEARKRKLFMVLLFLMAGAMAVYIYISCAGGQEQQKLKEGLAYFFGGSAQPGMEVEVELLNYDWFSQPSFQWQVDGKIVSQEGPSYTPDENDLEKMLTVTIQAEGYEDQTLSVFCSRLPVLYVDVEDGAEVATKKDYQNAYYVLQGAGEYQQYRYEGETQIKGRGNTSWNMDKKPYKLKLENKEDLLGMGENRHWVLLANYTDISLMRNTLAFRAAEEIGLVSMETQWVELVLNGEYVGNYQLCQQIRPGEDRVPVTDLEKIAHEVAEECVRREMIGGDYLEELKEMLENDLSWLSTRTFQFYDQKYQIPADIQLPAITGGFILEIDEYFDEPSKFETAKGQPVMFHSPVNAWSNLELMDYAMYYVQAIEDAIYAENHQTQWQGVTVHYTDLIDLDSLAKYWLISEFFCNEDLGKKSVYLYKDLEGKAYMGPIWDMDWSSGGSENTQAYDQWATLTFSAGAQQYMWYKELVKDPEFLTRVYELYHQYRYIFEEITKEGGDIDQYYEYLYDSGLANEKLWKTDSGFTEEVTEVLKPWLRNRLQWMDEQFATLEGLTASLNL